MFNIKKVPLRTFIITKEKLPKKDLIRVVRDKDGNVSIDPTGKANGRGAYLKKDLSVVEKARISKQLDHHLEVNIPDNVYDELKTIINNWKRW